MANAVRSACYSNIQVYEANVRGIPLMIRKEDSYVNATQILRAAGLPKPARTKVLDRQVSRGIHEKVQGGYAGSQGTWIPLTSARELAETYGILEECEVLFSYDMSSGAAEAASPPQRAKRAAQKQVWDGDGSSSDEKEKVPAPSRRMPRDSKRMKSLAEDEDDDNSSSDSRYEKPVKRNLGRARLKTYERLADVQMARTNSAASKGDPNRSCEVCNATETPQWRRGPSGKRTLCNACGVKWSSGRLVLQAPGSPFPFTTTESENIESSDATSGLEDNLEVGTSAWKLQLEVSRLKSKLREVDKSHRRLTKLLTEGSLADRQIDRSYRRLLSIAKKSKPKTYSPLKANQLRDLFVKQEFTEPLDDPNIRVQFGDASSKDLQLESTCVKKFIAVVKQA